MRRVLHLISLGEQENMLSAFEKIENSVREATAREHLAHYAVLELPTAFQHQSLRFPKGCVRTISR